MTIAISGTTGITLAGQFDSANTFGFKNRIINGAMVIDQRNAGAAVTNTNSRIYSVDRFCIDGTVASKYTAQQVNVPTALAGYTKALKITSSAATTVASTDYYYLAQIIEGFNVADLAWGTASAATVTLSFWVYSSLTGTFGGSIRNFASNRSYPFTYSVGSANTWTQISVTIAGDTSGTWATDSSGAVALSFGLGVGTTFSGSAGAWAAANYVSATGATSVVGTNGATFYITGVQLEKSSIATTFDYRPYGTELALCQRYYFKNLPGNATILSSGLSVFSTTIAQGMYVFPVSMRTAPSALEQSGTAADYSVATGSGATTCSAVPSFSVATTQIALSNFIVASGLTAGNSGWVKTASANAYLAWSAEL